MVWMGHDLFNRSGLRDILFFPSFGKLRITLLWALVYRILWGHKFSFLWDNFQGMWYYFKNKAWREAVSHNSATDRGIVILMSLITPNGIYSICFWYLVLPPKISLFFSFCKIHIIVFHHSFKAMSGDEYGCVLTLEIFRVESGDP